MVLQFNTRSPCFTQCSVSKARLMDKTRRSVPWVSLAMCGVWKRFRPGAADGLRQPPLQRVCLELRESLASCLPFGWLKVGQEGWRFQIACVFHVHLQRHTLMASFKCANHRVFVSQLWCLPIPLRECAAKCHLGHDSNAHVQHWESVSAPSTGLPHRTPHAHSMPVVQRGR